MEPAFIAVIAVAVFVAVGTERVGYVAAGAEVAPAKTQREIKRSPCFAGNDVFRIKQAGPANVFRPDGDLRHPVALFPQAQLHVEGFVFIGLIAGEGVHAAVLFCTHVGVAQRGLQPREQLHGRRVVTVLIVIAIVKADFPSRAIRAVGVCSKPTPPKSDCDGPMGAGYVSA